MLYGVTINARCDVHFKLKTVFLQIPKIELLLKQMPIKIWIKKTREAISGDVVIFYRSKGLKTYVVCSISTWTKAKTKTFNDILLIEWKYLHNYRRPHGCASHAYTIRTHLILMRRKCSQMVYRTIPHLLVTILRIFYLTIGPNATTNIFGACVTVVR